MRVQRARRAEGLKRQGRVNSARVFGGGKSPSRSGGTRNTLDFCRIFCVKLFLTKTKTVCKIFTSPCHPWLHGCLGVVKLYRNSLYIRLRLTPPHFRIKNQHPNSFCFQFIRNGRMDNTTQSNYTQ